MWLTGKQHANTLNVSMQVGYIYMMGTASGQDNLGAFGRVGFAQQKTVKHAQTGTERGVGNTSAYFQLMVYSQNCAI